MNLGAPPTESHELRGAQRFWNFFPKGPEVSEVPMALNFRSLQPEPALAKVMMLWVASVSGPTTEVVT